MALRNSHGFLRYALSVQYHGLPHLGFAYQGPHAENTILADGTDLRGYWTVEGRIRQALDALVGEGNHENFQVSSRTDRGVHALRNTCHVDLRRREWEAGRKDVDGEDVEQNLSGPDPSWEPLTVRRGLNYHLGRQAFRSSVTEPEPPIKGRDRRTSRRTVQWGRKRRRSNRGGASSYQAHVDSTPFTEKESVDTKHAISSYQTSLRRNLMNDVRVLSCSLAPQSMLPNPFYPATSTEKFVHWNARYTATSRTYQYRVLYSRDDGLPFEWDRSWRVHDESRSGLDVESMREAATHLIGTHDFTAFRGRGCQRQSPSVTLKDITILKQPYYSSVLGWGCADGPSTLFSTPNEEPSLVTITVRGDAFLYRQVRNMVGCLVDVGRGRIGALDVKRIRDGRDRRVAPAMAPAQGLFLVDVEHGRFVF